MKKVVLVFLALFIFGGAGAFSACAKNPENPSASQISKTDPGDNKTEGNTQLQIDIPDAEIEDKNIFLVVSPQTEEVVLTDKIKCGEGLTWKLTYDKFAREEIPTKVAASVSGNLSDGDNLFYVSVFSQSEIVDFYTVTIHKIYLAQLYFYFDGKLLKIKKVYTGTEYDFAENSCELPGYIFQGWKDETDCTVRQKTIWKNENFYASLKANKYEIVLDSDGGSLPQSVAQKIDVVYDSSCFLPQPTKKGYRFIGWYNGTEQISDTSGRIYQWRIAKNITLKACYAKNIYEVSAVTKAFVDDENIGSENIQNPFGGGSYEYLNMAKMQAISPGEAYKFEGWVNERGELISAELIFDLPVEENVCLTALWKSYTVKTFVNDENAGTVSSSAVYPAGATVTINAVTAPGYTWAGWYTYGSEELVTRSKEYTFEKSNKKEEYLAKWIRCPITLETATLNVGTLKLSDTSIGEEATVSAQPFPAYDFAGWYKNGERVSSERIYSFIVSETPVTFTAKWEVKAELRNFEFTCTDSEVVIKSVIDKQAEKIIVPDYVTMVVKNAFNQCLRVTDLTLPFADKYLGYYFGAPSYGNNAFYVPHSLKTLKITRGTSTAQGFIYNCQMIDNVILPDTIFSIGESSFYNTAFSQFTMPKQLVSIGDKAFSENRSLLNIALSEKTKTIGASVFENCMSLTEISLSASLTVIGERAFYGCSEIKKLVIPYNVEEVGELIFGGVEKTTIYCEVPQKPGKWNREWNYLKTGSYSTTTTHNVVWNYKK